MNCLFLLVLLFSCNCYGRQEGCFCSWPQRRVPERDSCGCEERCQKRENCGCSERRQERENCGCEERRQEREDCGCEERRQEREDCGCDGRRQERAMPRYDDSMRSFSYGDTVPEMNQKGR